MFRSTLCLGVICLVISSCETKTQTGALTGASVGALGGAMIGGGEGAIIGGAVGAVGGALIGHALDEEDRAKLEKQNKETLNRVEKGQPLTTNDVKEMWRAGLSSEVIINQIKATHTTFHLSTADIVDLKNAGVPENIINYMIETGNEH